MEAAPDVTRICQKPWLPPALGRQEHVGLEGEARSFFKCRRPSLRAHQKETRQARDSRLQQSTMSMVPTEGERHRQHARAMPRLRAATPACLGFICTLQIWCQQTGRIYLEPSELPAGHAGVGLAPAMGSSARC